MNRKGQNFLTENALSVIIAVIGIVIVAALFARLYVGFTKNNDVENAKSFLDELTAKIDAIPENQEVEVVLRGFDGKEEGWYLVAYDERQAIDARPDKCSLKSCLCLSPEPNAESCQNEGIHRNLDFKEVFLHSRVFEGGVPPAGRTVYYDCVGLDSSLITFRVLKNGDELNIFLENPPRVTDCNQVSPERYFTFGKLFS